MVSRFYSLIPLSHLFSSLFRLSLCAHNFCLSRFSFFFSSLQIVRFNQKRLQWRARRRKKTVCSLITTFSFSLHFSRCTCVRFLSLLFTSSECKSNFCFLQNLLERIHSGRFDVCLYFVCKVSTQTGQCIHKHVHRCSGECKEMSG